MVVSLLQSSLAMTPAISIALVKCSVIAGVGNRNVDNKGFCESHRKDIGSPFGGKCFAFKIKFSVMCSVGVK